MTIPEISKPFNELSTDIVEELVQKEVNERIKILEKINAYFVDLEKVVEGKGSLTSTVERFGEALIANTVPTVMSDIWDGTDYPEEWIRIIGRKT